MLKRGVMKTADLIPFILLELNECDKYGFELTKNIEAKSGGKIVIKQPTLYTLLKKLEKSKFIASYWQDSDIGGKRHYYKITENGRLQISTLPSYAELLKNALNEDVEIEIFSTEPITISSQSADIEKPLSIMDELLNQNVTVKETIVPSSEVFAEQNIDSLTELETNLTNTDILKQDDVSAEEKFAENADVMKFTEKTTSAPPQPIVKEKSNNDIFTGEFISPRSELEIKHVDYVDFKNSKENKYAKKVATKKLLQVLATSVYLIFIAGICELITMFTSHSTLYYLFLISSILLAVFYPVIYISQMEKFRRKCQTHTYSIKIKQRIFVGLTILLAILILSVVVSVCVGKNTIAQILSVSNFPNLYAPLLFFSAYFADLLFYHIIVSKINK